MERMIKLTRLAGKCDDPGYCPAIDLSERGTLIFTGPAVRYDALRAGPGEESVELSLEFVKEAMHALERR